MSDPVRPEVASPAELEATPVPGRRTRLWGKLKRFRGPIAAVAGGGAILSGLLGYWSAYQTVEKVAAPRSAPAIFTADAGALSIVVLPFQNLTGDQNQEYVADGLTAELTADLSRIRDAFIVTATTAFAYKDKPVTARQVGNDLGVRFVLQGSVQRSGNKLRVSAQLADATSNAQLWSDSFEGEQSDLFALQYQVTARIGNSIGREMVIVAARESETRKSNPKASDLVLRARALGLQPESLNSLQRQEDLYRQALALEPNNVNVMVALATTLSIQADNFFFPPRDDSIIEKKYAGGVELVQADHVPPARGRAGGRCHHGDSPTRCRLAARPRDRSGEARRALDGARSGGQAGVGMTIPRVIAHRGSSAVHADNSWAAFKAAVTEGADAIECDVQLTRDGALVVCHDLALKAIPCATSRRLPSTRRNRAPSSSRISSAGRPSPASTSWSRSRSRTRRFPRRGWSVASRRMSESSSAASTDRCSQRSRQLCPKSGPPSWSEACLPPTSSCTSRPRIARTACICAGKGELRGHIPSWMRHRSLACGAPVLQ